MKLVKNFCHQLQSGQVFVLENDRDILFKDSLETATIAQTTILCICAWINSKWETGEEFRNLFCIHTIAYIQILKLYFVCFELNTGVGFVGVWFFCGFKINFNTFSQEIANLNITWHEPKTYPHFFATLEKSLKEVLVRKANTKCLVWIRNNSGWQ